MNQLAQKMNQLAPQPDDDELPVVIVGTGPVGLKVARELHRRKPGQRIVVYGDEPWAPYNRVQLSSFLSGEIDAAGIEDSWDDMDPGRVTIHLGTLVSRIDPGMKQVEDFRGEVCRYSQLVLATGSRPHIPSIPGVDLPGVYTFRGMDDAQALMARRKQSKHTVVVGGGLLGLEIARAMQQENTEVSLIDHLPRLMGKQLDEHGAEMLREYVMSMGMRVYLESGVKKIAGDGKVMSIETHRGAVLECDTVILATGIVPNIDLAKNAGLGFGRGIHVDDNMRTSNKDIFAVGECAEHGGKVYGLVAPGIEQAGVAAHVIAGGNSRYKGSVLASKLKVLGKTVFSSGDIDQPGLSSIEYRSKDNCTYRKLVLKRGRLAGVIAYGDWEEINRAQQAVSSRKYIYPWQRMRFRSGGRIWPEHASELVASWPADTKVCQCTGVTRGQLCDAMLSGCDSSACLTDTTGAGSVCGSCKPLLQQFITADTRAQPLPLYKTLLGFSLLSVMAALALMMLPPIANSQLVETRNAVEQLWTDSVLRQWTGFTMLGLLVLAMTISARKRMRLLRKGDFNLWRLLHIGLALLMAGLLFVHTGLQMGQGINRWLLVSMLAIVVSGALAGTATAFESFIGGIRARRLRSTSFWLHLLGFWPLPVLLGVHVLSVYYF